MANDQSDEEVVQQLLKAMSKCRKCSHVRMAHSKLGKRTICLDTNVVGKERFNPCRCKDFVPKNNLEYLEWAAENKKGELGHD